jgi:hypothetical protein
LEDSGHWPRGQPSRLSRIHILRIHAPPDGSAAVIASILRIQLIRRGEQKIPVMASEARPSILKARADGMPRCARSDDQFGRRDEIFSSF